MSENKFWVHFQKCAMLVIVVLILSITASCQNTKWTIKKMVEAGADPIDAACAIGGDGKPTSIQCVIHDFRTK